MQHEISVQEPKMKPTEARQALAEYRADRWFPSIKQWTFDTEILPLPIEEARALTQFRERQRMLVHYHHTVKKRELDHEEHEDIRSKVVNQLPVEHQNALKNLTARLEPAIQRYTQTSGGAFVKLSTRSPKDAALNCETIKSLIREDIHKNKNTLPPNSQAAEIADMISFTRNCSRALRVTTAAQALELLLSSQRTFQDLLMCELLQTDKQWDMQLIVREWCNIDVEWEFRAFVFENVMTAITQYYPLCFVPDFPSKKSLIAERLLNFWRDNLYEIPYLHELRHYTIDFVASPDLKSVHVIEINNPPPVAGTSLFDWSSAADQELIYNGPFTLRILEAPLSNPKDQIYPPTKSLSTHCEAFRVRCGDFDMCKTCHDQGKPHAHPLVPRSTSEPTDDQPLHQHAESSGSGCTLS